MKAWRLIDLGLVEPLLAQTLYEAIALAIDKDLSPNTIVLCQPSKPYVCIGYHQELEREIDLEYCNQRKLPIIRRMQGGGAVYLDGNQVFYQVVASEDCETIPYDVAKLFEKFLQVTVYVYRKLGIQAKFKPINDVVVGKRKISGNGAGKIGSVVVLIGNIILDLDYDSMAHTLRVPSEKFRDKLVKTMQEWVTSLKRELGYVPEQNLIKKLLIEGYEKIGVNLVPGALTDEEKRIFAEEVKPKHLSREWLYMPELRHPELIKRRVVKITGDVRIVEATYKARKMIRVTMEIAFRKIRDIMISGDFFLIPEDALQKLEERLKGVSLKPNDVLKRVTQFYDDFNVQTPGIEPKDFVKAIMMALEI